MPSKKNTYKLYLVMVAVVLFCCSCSDSNVKVIKKSTFSDNSAINIEDTLDGIFKNTDWESKSENGRTKVVFTGEVTRETHQTMVKELGSSIHFDSISELYNQYKNELRPYKEKVEKFKSENKKGHRTKKRLCDEYTDKYNELINNISMSNSHIERIDGENSKYQQAVKKTENEIEELKKQRKKILGMSREEIIALGKSKSSWYHVPKTDFDFEQEYERLVHPVNYKIDRLSQRKDMYEYEIEVDLEQIDAYRAKIKENETPIPKFERLKNSSCNELKKINYIAKLNKLTADLSEKENELLKKYQQEFNEDYLYPVGSWVRIKWIFLPNQSHEVTSLECETLGSEDCLYIYTKAVFDSNKR